MITFSFFNWVEICPLKILDKCKSEESLIVNLPYDCRDLFPTKFCGCAKAPFASDELKSVFARSAADGNWLEQTACLQTFL